jgi:alkyldihydroxyacetonephosphate synthase
LADRHNVVIVPYGGGTNVTSALSLDKKERRMIISLDMTRMNAIKWVDKEAKLACV